MPAPPQRPETQTDLHLPEGEVPASVSEPGDLLLQLLGITALIYGALSVIQPVRVLLIWIVAIVTKNSGMALLIWVQVQLLSELVPAISAALLTWGGFRWLRHSGNPAGLVLWGAGGLIAGEILLVVVSLYDFQPAISSDSLEFILSRVMPVVYTLPMPILLMLLARKPSFRESFVIEPREVLESRSWPASTPQIISNAANTLQEWEQPRSLSYFRGFRGTAAAIVAPTLRLAGICTVVLGISLFITFLRARRIDERFTIARDLFQNTAHAIDQLIELVSLPVALLLVLGGIGALKLRPGVRRWLISAGFAGLLLSVAVWVMGARHSFYPFDAIGIGFLIRRVVTLARTCLFPVFLILAFRQTTASAVLPERTDGRHWWETELPAAP